MKKLLLPLIVLVILLSVVIFLTNKKTTSQEQLSTGDTTTENTQDFSAIFSLGVPVLEVNGSTQTGGVSFVEEEDGKLKVTLDLTPLEEGTEQAVDIRLGACPTPGETIAIVMNSLTDGKGEIKLEQTLDDFLKELPMVVAVHRSGEETSEITACGDIMLPQEE